MADSGLSPSGVFTAVQLVPNSPWDQSPGLGWRLKEVFDGQSHIEHALEVFLHFGITPLGCMKCSQACLAYHCYYHSDCLVLSLAGVMIEYPELEGTHEHHRVRLLTPARIRALS